MTTPLFHEKVYVWRQSIIFGPQLETTVERGALVIGGVLWRPARIDARRITGARAEPVPKAERRRAWWGRIFGAGSTALDTPWAVRVHLADGDDIRLETRNPEKLVAALREACGGRW